VSGPSPQTAEPKHAKLTGPVSPRSTEPLASPTVTSEVAAAVGRNRAGLKGPGVLTRRALPALQRAAGNQSVLRLMGQSRSQETPVVRASLQRSLSVAGAEDAAEVEADRVSAAVVAALGNEPARANAGLAQAAPGHDRAPGGLHTRLPSPARVEASARALGQVPQISQRVPAGRIHRCPFGKSAPPELSDVLTKGKGDTPTEIAGSLEASSPEFARLRGAADQEVAKTFGKGKKLEYEAKKKGVIGPPAYYDQGKATFDMGHHRAQTALNVVFETANAAQAGRFQAVKDDYDADTLMGKRYDAYGVDVSELDGLPDAATTPAAKLSLIQEAYEWDSLKLARSSFEEIMPEFQKDKTANAYLETSFGEILKCKSFMEYYKVFGQTHRNGVQSRLEEKATPSKSAESEPAMKRPGMFA
jgi:hypothetical protein